MSQIHKFFATAPKGLEPVLAQELTAMGLVSVTEARGGVHFQGGLEAGYRACLESRIANRILLPVAEFRAASPEELYDGISKIHWNDHLNSEKTLAVDFSSSASQIRHTQYGALKVKDAVVDQFRRKTGSRPSVSRDRPDVRINVYLNRDQAIVSIDLSGESLHERGYRELGAPAPLKENLAAGILAYAEWQKKSEQGSALIDPMCGHGTLVIEAALIAARRAPALNRKYFGFLGWKPHDPRVWNECLERAQAQVIRDPKKLPTLVGYDQDPRAIRACISNLARTGLAGGVHFEKRELERLEPVPSRAEGPVGLVVVNPPYGERLGETDSLRGLYGRLGDLFKQRMKGWDGYIFTGNPELAKSVGLKTSRKWPLFNGAIECRLLRYELY